MIFKLWVELEVYQFLLFKKNMQMCFNLKKIFAKYLELNLLYNTPNKHNSSMI